MSNLYLVRHGQASFGAEDYDNLSELGHKQALRLGEYFKQKGLQFDAVLTGTLRRHVQTYAGIAQGAGFAQDAGFAHVPLQWPGLNEYDSHAVIEAIHPYKLDKPDTPERYRHHFRLLKDGLTQWMNGVVSPKGMPTYDEFQHGVVSALEHVRKNHTGNVLIVSSGGPISTAVGHILGTTPETTIELNLRIRNCSITEFAYTPKRHMLVTYNTLPHLEDLPEWVTYS
ncbi:MAG: histidine phosphatase family protein [Burkholderiaceae bacterium]